MKSNLSKCRITTPEDYVGEIMGKLTNLGAWLGEESEDTEVKNDGGVTSFVAQVPDEKINEFKKWLDTISKGRGEIEVYT